MLSFLLGDGGEGGRDERGGCLRLAATRRSGECHNTHTHIYIYMYLYIYTYIHIYIHIFILNNQYSYSCITDGNRGGCPRLPASRIGGDSHIYTSAYICIN